jgi:hypothetical protein
MAQAPNLYTVTVTIANGASLSGQADVNGANLVAILMPAAWTAAGLTFQGSLDGTNFANVFDSIGAEVSIPSAAATASQMILIPAGAFDGMQSIKLRSGTSGSAVNQGAAATLTLQLRRYY